MPQPRPEPTPTDEYPPFVQDPAERERWDYARAIARQIFGDDDANAWQATRSIYQSATPLRSEGDA